MPFRFLQKLNLKFNLVIIDTSHIMPGEVLNIIEIMPFLEDNAIIIFPNLISHMKTKLCRFGLIINPEILAMKSSDFTGLLFMMMMI